jgi:hypothetical protein
MSEIDDIFAFKGNAKAVSAHSHGPSSPSSMSKKERKKKQKSAADVKVPVDSQEKVSSSKKRRLPETIIDTSNNLHSPPKRHKTVVRNKSKAGKGGDASNVDNPEDVAIFKDSRGTSSRKLSTLFRIVMSIDH